MASATSMAVVSAREGYRQWARSYDAEPNALLALEKRCLEPLLPCARGLDVVDLGCGTGRWLEALKERGAHSLLGVVVMIEQLRIALPSFSHRSQSPAKANNSPLLSIIL